MADKLILDPQTIVNKQFDVEFKGYNPGQVDQILDQVIQDYQTYESMIQNLKIKMQDLERTNASLRAKLIQVEGQEKAQEDADPILKGSNNVDVLKRLRRLEDTVFSNQNKQ